MKVLPKSVQNLIDQFAKLPGIGLKSASRLVVYILEQDRDDVERFSKALATAKDAVRRCRICSGLAEGEICKICEDENRDLSVVLAVESPLDIVAIEKTGYEGVYHVLGGAISPIDGIGPQDLNISSLIERLGGKVKELIIATNPSLEGEATAMYIVKKINERKKAKKIAANLKVTRIARGLPTGGDIEYADEMTLKKALEGRNSI